MKSKANKKLGLVAMLTALLWFPVKSLWQSSYEWSDSGWSPVDFSKMQPMYGVPYDPYYDEITDWFILLNLCIILITFIFWIISFFKIRKINDKDLRRKKIIKTLCIIAVLIVIILLLLQYIWMRDKGVFEETL